MKKKLELFIYICKSFLFQKFRQYNKKLPYIITAVLAFIIFMAGLKLFVELTEGLKTDLLANIDTKITQYIISYRTPSLTSFFVFVTRVGDRLGYVIVFVLSSLLFYFIFKSWRYVIQLMIVLLVAASSNVLLKQIINRARPDVDYLVTVKTLSYPSGHAMSAMAFYGFLIYLFYTFNIPKLVKYGIIVFLTMLILSIGISRIYLGVHFPSDIAGGFIAGFIWIVFCILILNILNILKEDPST